ncbi:glycosyltransferase [Oceanihabitans sp. 2_MG-2023]|uniref:glycosyltransferase n=1 Tax=Oceanihabitans sp. 2_MG-2023 TaxID=3062661 RepID=UPI0026E38F81|nr:glycosyltransferase [Oceanihabitans sp. 2_MG-2023]MDO6597684.1 glycosyltransferase [Oceanihabitans sp. 2_MG-2023]
MDEAVNGVSVILCCYNSVNRLPETLKHLAHQNVENTVSWEIILVNNNSSDATAKEAISIWKKLGDPVPLTVVNEKNPGLSFAREKGMAVANYNVFLFCDDDNWLQNDYVKIVFNTFQINPEIGAVGGWCEAVFEADKPEWFDAFAGNFAVGKPATETGCINNTNQYIYGAGMALRKSTIKSLKQKGFKNILTDRKGKQLSSGGDVELIYGLKLINVKVMFQDALFFHHFMPKNRMQWEYLLKLRTSMYWSNFVLHIYLDALKNKKVTFKFMLNKIKKSLVYIYTKSKALNKLEPNKGLFLKNQIEVKKMFLTHTYFYYKTRIALKKIQNG